MFSLKCIFKDGWTEQQCKNVNSDSEGGISSNKKGAGDRRQRATKRLVNLVQEGTVAPLLINTKWKKNENIRGKQTAHHIKA